MEARDLARKRVHGQARVRIVRSLHEQGMADEEIVKELKRLKIPPPPLPRYETGWSKDLVRRYRGESAVHPEWAAAFWRTRGYR